MAITIVTIVIIIVMMGGTAAATVGWHRWGGATAGTASSRGRGVQHGVGGQERARESEGGRAFDRVKFV